MKYLSICSGIEAATVAWHPLGWEPFAFAEIDKFPAAVLNHHYPNVPNLGDMTRFKEWPDAAINLLVGGTPCQSFSVAGLRKGLDDPRGNLMLTYLAIADKYRPEWLVWENVPGVLSSNRGRDFGTFLGGLGQLGYGFAYRVLDAQYFGVPQRRRRVFVVGCLGGWQRAAAVLFERQSLSWDTPPSRQAGQRVAATLTRGAESNGRGGYAGRRREDDVNIVAALTANGVGTCGADDNQGQAGHLIPSTGSISHCLNAGGMGRQDYETETLITHTLRGEGFDASEDGTGRGTPLVPVAFNLRGREGGAMPEASDLASLRAASGGSSRSYVASTAVRRLTPKECERLQGFPDNYTNVPYRGKAAADGPRYKALGNSMAVPVMHWIGERIQAVEQITTDNAETA